MPNAAVQRGLLKLMLKLPALRAQLQLLSARNQSLASLCEAYEEASSMLDRQWKRETLDHSMISEYELICREIEEEVLSICIADTGREPSPL